MGEAKLGCVQCLTMKLQFLQYLTVTLSRTTVDRIAEQRMIDRSHVNPDLVRAPGFEAAFDQSRIIENIEPPPASHRALAALALHDRDLLAVGCRAGDGRIDCAIARLRNAID